MRTKRQRIEDLKAQVAEHCWSIHNETGQYPVYYIECRDYGLFDKEFVVKTGVPDEKGYWSLSHESLVCTIEDGKVCDGYSNWRIEEALGQFMIEAHHRKEYFIKDWYKEGIAVIFNQAIKEKAKGFSREGNKEVYQKGDMKVVCERIFMYVNVNFFFHGVRILDSDTCFQLVKKFYHQHKGFIDHHKKDMQKEEEERLTLWQKAEEEAKRYLQANENDKVYSKNI